MHRQLIAETSGHSFLRKFRNGLEALDEEIKKLETITQDLQNPHLPRTYFQKQADFLSCIDSVLADAEQLHEEISTKLINVDHVENRLLKVRERLLRFEEDPKLLALGYKPFVPKDLIQLSDEDDNDDDEDSCSLASTNDDHQVISDFDDLNDNQHQEENVVENFGKKLSLKTVDTVDTPKSLKKQNQDESFNILSTLRKNKQKNHQFQQKQEKSAKKKKPKIDPTKINNPMLARAFALCDRWIKDDKADSSLDQSTIQNDDRVDGPTANDNGSNGNLNPKPNGMKQDQTKTNSSSVKMNANFTPSVRNRLFRLESRPSDNLRPAKVTPKLSVKKNVVKKTIKNEHFVQLEEYETVEFTPGMTTKVRKSGDGKNP